MKATNYWMYLVLVYVTKAHKWIFFGGGMVWSGDCIKLERCLLFITLLETNVLQAYANPTEHGLGQQILTDFALRFFLMSSWEDKDILVTAITSRAHSNFSYSVSEVIFLNHGGTPLMGFPISFSEIPATILHNHQKGAVCDIFPRMLPLGRK